MRRRALPLLLLALAAPVLARQATPRTGAPDRAPTAMTSYDLTRALDQTGRETLRGIAFQPGTATITPDSRTMLAAIAEVLTRQPTLKLAIRVYAAEPGAKDTLALARARAAALRASLIARFAIAPDRLVAEGFAEMLVSPGQRAGAPTPAGSQIELVKIAAKDTAAAAFRPGPGEWTGRIAAGMLAIGGETTGLTIATGQGRLELQVADQTLRKRLQELNGKTVTVRGTLEIRPGVEVGTRRIVTVSEIVEPPAPSGR
jgi:OmpA family